MIKNAVELRKFVAPEFIFGSGAVNLSGRYAKNVGASKVLVVTDKGVIDAGWADSVIQSLENESISCEVYADVTPNPEAEEVMAGAEAYAREKCDVIIAVGGGSPMDCAKGIGVVSTNNKNILDLKGADNIKTPGPPLICVPTTAGTSADISQFAIITDDKEKMKVSIVSKKLVPDVSLIDPVTTTTMSPELTAQTGMDAFSHAVESYVSNASSPITDMFALEAIRLISSNVRRAIRKPYDIDARSQMVLGSLNAGLAFSNASLGANHALSHSLGGYLNCTHGACDSILMRYVINYNFDHAQGRYQKIGEAMGLNLKGMSPAGIKAALIGEITKLIKDLDIDMTAGELGLRKKDIPMLARKAIEDVCIVTNPRPVIIEDIEAIYEDALAIEYRQESIT